MRVALAQINPTVSDLSGNRDLIVAKIREARGESADVVIFPELAVMGYPPKDLLLKPAFVADAQRTVEDIARHCDESITALVGFAEANPEPAGRPLFNSVARCRGGRIVEIHRKTLLPTYDVFDESRYFEPAGSHAVAVVPAKSGGVRMGISICEDLWNDADFVRRPLYHANPVVESAREHAQLVVNVSASPFVVEKQAYRERLFGGQAAKHRLPIVVVNQVGGNDELVFDGASCAFNARGEPIARAKAFAEDLLVVDLDVGAKAGRIEPYPDATASIHDALVLGTRDYVRKCGFSEVVIGLSGGIDSAVTAALAVEALGPKSVHGVALPSRYSSEHSLEDARALAVNLGIRLDVIPITQMHAAAEQTLSAVFAGLEVDVTEENVQARIRGVLLMALANKFGKLRLTTGNKSELAVGFCTLYGDMCGGLAVISDVPKTTVYDIGRLINQRAGREVIPARTFEKPPSAELRPNQTDQDTIPPYPVVDAVIQNYVEQEKSLDEIVALGFERELVARIIRMIDGAEYKRRQAAQGLKVTSRAFGFGRRMPIATGRC